ncbi:anthranilate synthase component 1 [Nocardiopsis mwathae]|uniref:Anthranilate synthase component 1 n=1 Tax=Nocardiopsis mwathae TaxID=1472723 RepID=A0A7W9YLV6_9ACTN|nr:chorismate-binding protein [Nocardiopsis mwathae]MBB6174553.1 anthranilate synthase component 1 [Nocardiopsis mwathae]
MTVDLEPATTAPRALPALDARPNRAEAADLARDHALIPVYREYLADTLSPLTLFARLCRADEPGFLLEGASVGGGAARYSYIGHRPEHVPAADTDPLRALRALVGRPAAPVPGLPPFHGGVFGYLGYEGARHFERLPAPSGAAPGLPESAFFHVGDLAVVDHAARRLLLVTVHRPENEEYDAALRRIDRMHERVLTPAPGEPGPEAPRPLPPPPPRGAPPTGWRSTTTRAEFTDRVRRAREYILAGDAFQIVLSQRFAKPLRARPIDVYRHLRAVNPSPYMYQLNLGGGRHVIGASPELLVQTQGRRVRTRPLAGTRPRGADSAADLELERELRADGKECAEHVMLVDLGRNDIGRVAVPGTVHPERFMDVERFSHVMHLSSTVVGDLAPGTDSLDALRSTFPAGTLSGAPKIRAMEIIAELEAERRGVYGGALGHIGFGGDADLAIALRTLVIADGQVYAQSGAGVVADSDPDAEYAETLHKAGAMFTAVHNAEALS